MTLSRIIVGSMIAIAIAVAGAAPSAFAGCAKFSCINTQTGRCYFVVFRRAEAEARFELAKAEHRWISGVSRGDTYCATGNNRNGACPIRFVRDIKEECAAPVVSLRDSVWSQVAR
jgi:hypothetical protein